MMMAPLDDGFLAGQWEAAAITAPPGSPRLPRCRQYVLASLNAALDKAQHELRAFKGPGVICFTGSLHAAAQAALLGKNTTKEHQVMGAIHRLFHT
eukprot:gene17755-24116_t